MAFFGLTLGPECPFKAVDPASVNLALFDDDDRQASFRRIAREGFLRLDQVEAFFEDLYHGPAPEIEIEETTQAMEKFIMATADVREREREELAAAAAAGGAGVVPPSDGIGWRVLRDILDEVDDMYQKKIARDDAEKQSKSVKSSVELNALRLKNNPGRPGPADVLSMPLTATQRVGWELANNPDEPAGALKTLKPKRKCAETRFQENLIATGQYY